MAKRPYSLSVMDSASQGFLKAARDGNVDQLIEYLDNNEVDINAANANGLGALHLAAKEGHALVVMELLRRRAYMEASTKKGYRALHIASLAGQEEIVRLLLENGAQINTQSQTGFTPLYMSAQENHPNVVRCLLENNADPTIATEDGYTPLAVALQLGHDDVVGLLMDYDTARGVGGGDQSGRGSRAGKGGRLPPLHNAAKKEDVQAAMLLLRNAHNADTNSKTGGSLVNDITKGGFTPLHIAAHYGNIKVGQLLIDSGADVDFKARNSITPLHVASKWGRTNMVKLLVDHGARLDCATRDGLSPLHCAARSGHDQVVSVLLANGAPLGSKTKNGLVPLHMSAQGDHILTSQILLQHGAPIEDVTVDYLTSLHVTAHCGNVKACKLLLDSKCDMDARALNGFTSLHVACKKNRLPIIELLLRYGATLEATTETGMTPLHVASFLGHKDIVSALLQNGADPNKKTNRGETSLHLATRGDQMGIMEILLNNGAEVDAKAKELQTPLHIAARQGHTDNVKLLLQHGASPNSATKDLYTPLHIAAREGHLEVAKVLLDNGADPKLTTKKGFAPLHIAAKHGHLPMTKLLIERGGNVDVIGRNELTPLHVATHYDNEAVALHLLDKGANPVAQAKNGYTPLHIAAKRNVLSIARDLLKRGAKPNAESKNGFTPLHLATKEGHIEMISLLLENGADPEARAKNGLAPMHLAAQEDHVPAAELLERYNASIDPQTKAGYTPLHTACHFGQINMIEFLLRHGAKVNAQTKYGYTPLHQAAQQGHLMVINILLKYKADPNILTTSGHTGLSIAEELGYLSVVELLKRITDAVVSSSVRGRYKPISPETMQEASTLELDRQKAPNLNTIDEEELSDFGSLPRPGVQSRSARSSRVVSDAYEFDPHDPSQWLWLGSANASGSRSPFKDDGDLFGDRSFERYSGVTPSMERRAIEDELRYMREPLQDDEKYQSTDTMTIPPSSERVKKSRPSSDLMSGCELCLRDSPYGQKLQDGFASRNKPPFKSGVVASVVADAENGSGRSCRHYGVRLIVPPAAVDKPTKITCRLIKPHAIDHPPQLLPGEAFASRIVELDPMGAKFKKPVLIEVPHFASLRGNERETTILVSLDGLNWREHPVTTNESDVVNVLQALIDADDNESEEVDRIKDPQKDDEKFSAKRITRIVTDSFPQYFAVISRVHEDLTPITPNGGAITSTSVPGVRASFPSGALTKNTQLGLQVQPVSKDLIKSRLGSRVSFSPIVTLEPVRRRFHKPIRLTIPTPAKSALKKRDGEPQTLRLLCSVTGDESSIDNATGVPKESSPVEMEDITDSTPMTISDDAVSFNTPLSARFWLVDCPNIDDSARMASAIYNDVTRVPFMAKFVVFAKRHHPTAARLRVYCVIDDNMDDEIGDQGKFVEVARSNDVEVLDGAPQYLEWTGNLVPVSKSRRQLSVDFHAFKENRVSFVVRVRDAGQEPRARLHCMREPKMSIKDGDQQSPMCSLDVCLPLVVYREKNNELQSDESLDDEDIDLNDLLPSDQNGYHNKQEEPLDELIFAQESAPVAHAAPSFRNRDSRQETPYEDQQLKFELASPNHIEPFGQQAFAAKGDQKEMLRKPEITQKIVEGDIQSHETVKEDLQNLPDGRSLKRKVVTTKRTRPITEMTMKDGVVLDSRTTEQHVGTDIEENILELPAGVIEPNASNCDTNISIDNSEVMLPDGIVAKKKVVRMVISLKGSPAATSKEVEGDIVSSETVDESEDKLPDGRTIRRKVITTTFVKPITELTTVGGRTTETRKRDELVGVTIEENVIELPVGIIEPSAANCDVDITVVNSEIPLQNTTVKAKKSVTRMNVRLKEEPAPSKVPGVRPECNEPECVQENFSGVGNSQVKPAQSSSNSGDPRTSGRNKDKKPGHGVIPEGGSRIVDGDIEYRTEAKEDQYRRSDGATIKSKTVTKKHIKPISRITMSAGAERKTLLREELVGADIVENVLILPNGITEPVGENLTSESTVKNVEEMLPGGAIAKKKIVTTVVSRTPPQQKQSGQYSGNRNQQVSYASVEGKPEDRPSEAEDEDNWPDGTAIRRKEIVVKHVIPITEVTIANGSPPESTERERVLGVDILENILQLPCGVVEPHAANCQTDIVVKKSTVRLPDGTEANKKVVKMQARLKHGPLQHKCRTGDSYLKQEIVENKQNLPDGRITRQKVVTTKQMQPITEVTMKDGRVTDTRSREDVVGVDIDENILELPVGVIEPHAENCDTDVSVEPSFVTLPGGIKAKKTSVKTTVRLKDGASPQNRPGTKEDGQTCLPDGSKIVEGDVEYRKESKEDKTRRRDGGTVRMKTDTTKHVKPIYRIERVRGIDKKTLLREDLVGADIVENILELPPGVQEPNAPNLANECTVRNCEETLPGGIVAKKKIVRTIVSVIGGQSLRSSPPKEVPAVSRKNVEGDLEVKATVVESNQNLPDGTALRKKEVTLTHSVPVTEVIVANALPPDSTSWDKVVGADVVEANLRLPSGTIDPNGANCVTDIGISRKPVTLPDGVLANCKIIDMNVALEPPTSGAPNKQHKVTEGEIKPKEEVIEDDKNLENGSTIKRKVFTTKFIKPLTDTTTTNGVVTDATSWEEIVDAEIDENILRLPVGVIEPNASNVSVDIAVKNSEVELPEGILAKKSVVDITARIKDPRSGPAEDQVTPLDDAAKARLARIPQVSVASQIPEQSSMIVEGPVESKTSVGQNQQTLGDGTKLHSKKFTTRNTKPIYRVGKVNGVEHKALLREETVSAEVVENILEIPFGCPEHIDPETKMDTTVRSGEEMLPDGITAKKKIVKTIVLPAEDSRIVSIESARVGNVKSRPVSSNVPPTVKIIEGEVEPRSTVTEDTRTLRDGSTIKRKEITTRMVKPITEVTYRVGQLPESTSHDKVLSASVKEVILQLPAGVIEPNSANCSRDIAVVRSNVTLPDGTPAEKKLISVVVTLKEPKVTHSIVEGDAVSSTEVKEDEKNLRDGSMLRRKVITTKHSKPVTDITLTNGVFTSEQTVDKLVGIDIEENLIRLPVGIIEPYAGNCDTNISINTSEFALPDGSPGGRKKVVKMLVKLKGQPAEQAAEVFEQAVCALGSTDGSGNAPKSPTSRIVEGAIVFRTETDSDEKKLDDGTTLRSKRVTRRHVKPTIKIVAEDGVEKKTLLREEIVGADIEESVLELPPRVSDPAGYKCDTSVQNLQERLPDGTIAKKRVVTTIVLLPGQTVRKDQRPSPPRDITGGDDSKFPSTGIKAIEGDVEPRSTVVEDSKKLDRGRTMKRKTVTTRFVKPITEMIFKEGVMSSTRRREEIVRTEIDESVLELPAGVIEPLAKNCDTVITVENVDEVMPDGLPAKKRVVKMVVFLKEPELGRRLVEGEVVSKVDEKEDVKVLDDGSTSRKKTVTTRYVKPVREIKIVNGRETQSVEREEVVAVEIEEVTLNLPAGVIEPFGHNLDTRTKVEQVDWPMPDGVIAKKKIVTIDVKLKHPLPSNVTHKQIDGPITSRREESRDEATEPDGTVVKRHIVTTRFFKPVTDVTVVNGKETESRVTEQPAGVQVEENILKLCPGVTSEHALNVTRKTREKNVQEVLPDGSLAQKKITKTVVSLKEEPKEEQIEMVFAAPTRAAAPPNLKMTTDEVDYNSMKSTIKKTVRTKIRRIGPDGNITEDTFTEEEDLSSEPSSPCEPTSPFLFPGGTEQDPDNPLGIKVYTDTKETEPIVDRQVQEFEETLPDGTLVRRRVIKKTERRTITKRIIMEGPEQELLASADAHAQQLMSRAGKSDNQVTKYTDSNRFNPDTKTDLEEFNEVLPDGTVVRKRVKTTKQAQLTTERQLVTGTLQDASFRGIFDAAVADGQPTSTFRPEQHYSNFSPSQKFGLASSRLQHW